MQDDERQTLHDSDEFQVKLQHYKRKGMNHGRALMIAEEEMLAEMPVKETILQKIKKVTSNVDK